jgi:hypothetical protein
MLHSVSLGLVCNWLDQRFDSQVTDPSCNLLTDERRCVSSPSFLFLDAIVQFLLRFLCQWFWVKSTSDLGLALLLVTLEPFGLGDLDPNP